VINRLTESELKKNAMS